MANILTISRLAAALCLLFLPVFSVPFTGLYLLAGLTDMLDGPIARRTGTASETGAKLDTAADLVLTAVCLVKLLPVVDLPAYLWIWTGAIFSIKMVNIVSGLVVQRKFVAVHSAWNRGTGLLLFLLPLTWPWVDVRYSGSLVCAVATVAAIQEGHLIRRREHHEGTCMLRTAGNHRDAEKI